MTENYLKFRYVGVTNITFLSSFEQLRCDAVMPQCTFWRFCHLDAAHILTITTPEIQDRFEAVKTLS